MKPKIIRTEADYEAALARIDVLMDGDPEPTSAAGEELELLSLLVENYEKEIYPIERPSPLAAIQFRMEQAGLKAKDLTPYIGSASKVSEVLSGKRALSLAMIRNLVKLGIPAEVLLQAEGAQLPPSEMLERGRHFPLGEMVRRGWFPGFQGSVMEARSQREDLLTAFVAPLGMGTAAFSLNRQHVRNGGQQDEHALTAWRIRIASLAIHESLPAYKPGTVTPAFLCELARLSYLAEGPKLAKEFLNKSGIHVIFERHLPKTHLDGAALKLPDGSPVVALTLRHDRLDIFFDDMSEGGAKDTRENEADQLASEALIPETEWKAAKLTKKSPPGDVLAFAQSLRISPAIPAGRVRYESKSYTVFRPLIGSGKLRLMFGIQAD